MNKTKSRISKLMSFLIVVIIMFSVIVFSDYAQNNDHADLTGCEVGDNVVAVDGSGNEMLRGATYTMPTEILFNTRMLSLGENPSVSLFVTVSPATATYKAIEWLTFWEEPGEDDGPPEAGSTSASEEINDYLLLDVDSEDGTSIVITCLQKFTRNIVLQVVTVVGNFSAECLIKYVGNPVDWELNLPQSKVYDDGVNGVNLYVPANAVTNVPITLYDFFGNETFHNGGFNISIEYVGNVLFKDWTSWEESVGTGGGGSSGTWLSNPEIIPIMDFYNIKDGVGGAWYSGAPDEEYTLRGTAPNASLKMLNYASTLCFELDIREHFETCKGTGGFTPKYPHIDEPAHKSVFWKYESDIHHFLLTATESITGKSKSFQFVIIRDVENMTMSCDSVLF